MLSFPTSPEVTLCYYTALDIYTVFYNLFTIWCSRAPPTGSALGTDNCFIGKETEKSNNLFRIVRNPSLSLFLPSLPLSLSLFPYFIIFFKVLSTPNMGLDDQESSATLAEPARCPETFLLHRWHLCPLCVCINTKTWCMKGTRFGFLFEWTQYHMKPEKSSRANCALGRWALGRGEAVAQWTQCQDAHHSSQSETHRFPRQLPLPGGRSSTPF